MDYTVLGEVTEAMMKDEQGTEGGREIYTKPSSPGEE